MAARSRTRPRKKPRQARSEATVEYLLEAAARILVKDGYDGLSTNRVAEQAGISIGSLYQYFPGKEAIVAVLVERHFDEEIAVIQAKIADLAQAPLQRAVPELVRSLLVAGAVNPRLKRVFLEQVPRVGAFQRIRDSRRYTEGLVAAYLEAHRSETRPLDARLAAFLLVTAVDAILQVAKSERPEYLSDARLVDEVGALVLGYLH